MKNRKILKIMLCGSMISTLGSCGLIESLLGTNSIEVSNPSLEEGSTNHVDSSSVQVELSKQEQIYQLAKASGYQGSYEQWLNSIKGESVELAVVDNTVCWKYTSSSSWTKLLSLSDLKGEAGLNGETGKDGVDGKTPEFRVSNGYLQVKYQGESNAAWQNLVQLSTSSNYDTITVTFNPNNGESSFTQPVIPGYNVARPEEITYEGYIFKGWYYENSDDEWEFDYYSTSKDITLNAHWEEEESFLEPFGSITVWATPQEEKVIQDIVSEWNAEHDSANDFTINFRAVHEGDAGILLRDPLIEDGPALVLCADDHIKDLALKNIIAPLSEQRAKKVIENNTHVSVEGSSYDGELYGYPVTSDNGYFLWYNNSLVSEETIESLEDLLAYAEANGKQVLMDVTSGWYANSFLMSPDACGTDSLRWYVNDNGQNVYEGTWDSEEGVKVSTYIGELLSKYYKDGVLVTGSNDAIVSGFASGKMIAAVSGTWMEGDLEKAIGADKLAADKLPSYHIDGKAYQMASFTGSKIFAINKTRPAQEQITAAALAELLTTSQSQLVRFETRQALPCNNKAAADKRYTEHVSKGAAALNKQNQYACVQAKTAEGAYWSIGEAIGKAYLDPAMLGGETWAKFLKGQMDILRNPA